jgi:hypothetical protein
LTYLLWLNLLLISTITLSACSSEDDSSLADAAQTTPEQVRTLRDFFDGTLESKESEAANRAAVEATNTQTTLLIAILAVVILILVVVLLKNFKKRKI